MLLAAALAVALLLNGLQEQRPAQLQPLLLALVAWE
jgi:hypothetical protein